MTESLIRELRALCADGFTGTITLHIRHGEVARCEKLETLQLQRDDGLVDLSEAKGTGVDSGTPTTGAR